MRVRQKLHQIRNPKDLLLLLQIAALASVLPLLLRWIKLRALLRVLKPWNRVARVEGQQVDKIVRFTNFILGKGFTGKRTCLTKSLILYHFLKRAGVNVEINFGIRKGKGLAGHSWLTYQGSPYLDNEESTRDFEVIYSSEEIK
jgi:hypothetical protein